MSEISARDAINAVLTSELKRDRHTVYLGETIRDIGATGASKGLYEAFGASCDPPRRAPAQAPVSAALLPRPSPGSQPPGEPMPSYQAVRSQPLHPSMLLLFQEPASSQTFPDLGIPQ
jgi:hypothetical protein